MMRKTVQILGVGVRKSGTSKKSGKPYDFQEISIGYETPGFVGMRCETIAIDSALDGVDKLVPGEVVDIIFHMFNYKTYIDVIL